MSNLNERLTLVAHLSVFVGIIYVPGADVERGR